VPRSALVSEFGVLFTPEWWLLQDALTFLSGLSERKEDAIHAIILGHLALPDAPLRKRIDSVLALGGHTVASVLETDHSSCLRRARIRFILGMCDSLGLVHSPPSSRPPRRPRRYLGQDFGRYGFLFKLEHLGPSSRPVGPCYFCSCPGGDNGTHLLRQCQVARTACPYPPPLRKCAPQQRELALDLKDNASPALRAIVLSYMYELWKARRTLRAQPAQTTSLMPEVDTEEISRLASQVAREISGNSSSPLMDSTPVDTFP
jgi:hypothetical protein